MEGAEDTYKCNILIVEISGIRKFLLAANSVCDRLFAARRNLSEY